VLFDANGTTDGHRPPTRGKYVKYLTYFTYGATLVLG
jgi:hypothetical protein